jgi:hypothetical protein
MTFSSYIGIERWRRREENGRSAVVEDDGVAADQRRVGDLADEHAAVSHRNGF